MGTTIANNNTIIAHSATVGLKRPYIILVIKTTDNSIIVVNQGAQQVIRLYDSVLSINNVTLVAQNWSGENSLQTPYTASVRPIEKNRIYLICSFNQELCVCLR